MHYNAVKTIYTQLQRTHIYSINTGTHTHTHTQRDVRNKTLDDGKIQGCICVYVGWMKKQGEVGSKDGYNVFFSPFL